MDLLLYSEPHKVKTKIAGRVINFNFEGIAKNSTRSM